MILVKPYGSTFADITNIICLINIQFCISLYTIQGTIANTQLHVKALDMNTECNSFQLHFTKQITWLYLQTDTLIICAIIMFCENIPYNDLS